MPRKKKAFEDDDYDPIAAEVARAAAFVGRAEDDVVRSIQHRPMSKTAAAPVRERTDTDPLVELRQQFAQERSRRAALEARLGVLADERDEFHAELQSLRAEHVEKERLVTQLERRLGHLMQEARDVHVLVTELRWARRVSVGTLMIMIALTIWVVLGP